jgi:hypothetical protein
MQRAAQTPGQQPKGSAFFTTVVNTSGLSPIMGACVVQRACDMSGVEPERMTPENLRDMMPALRKGMNIYMSNPDIERALKRLEALLPKVMEDASPGAP